mgnify:CR=1 FL=1
MEAIELETKELLEEFHDAEEAVVRNYGSEWKAGESFLLEGCKDSTALLRDLRLWSKIVGFLGAVKLVLCTISFHSCAICLLLL